MTEMFSELQARRVHLHLDKQRVVFDVHSISWSFQRIQRNEARKADGHVARRLCSWLMEACVCGVRPEIKTLVVPGAALVQNRQRHGLFERPRQKSVEVSGHQNDVKGQVSSSSFPVSVEVGLHGHLVAAASGVEGHAAQTRMLTRGFGFPSFLEIFDLPDESAVVGGQLKLLQVLLVESELSDVELQETRVTLPILLQSC